MRALMLSMKVLQLVLQSAHHPSAPEAHPLEQKMYDRSVISDMSHRPIGPYSDIAASRSPHHASRATSSCARSAGWKQTMSPHSG